MGPSESWRRQILGAMHGVLQPAGFRQRGRLFWADRGGVVHLVDLQGDKWNQGSSCRYCVNLGIHSVDVDRHLAERPHPARRDPAAVAAGPFNPVTAERHISDRLAPAGGGGWWEVSSDAEAAAAAAAVQRLLTLDALPSFDRLATIEALAAYWRKGGTGGAAAATARSYLAALDEAARR